MAKSEHQFTTNVRPTLSLAPAESISSPIRLRALLAAQPFFRELGSVHIGLLAGLAMETQFAPGQFIFQQGDPANRFYLVLEGEVSLEIKSSDNRMIPIRMAGAGSDLGWSWMFDSSYFHVTARTINPTKTIFFYGTILRQQCEDDHQLGYEMMKRVAAATIHSLNAFQQNIVSQCKEPTAQMRFGQFVANKTSIATIKNNQENGMTKTILQSGMKAVAILFALALLATLFAVWIFTIPFYQLKRKPSYGLKKQRNGQKLKSHFDGQHLGRNGILRFVP